MTHSPEQLKDKFEKYYAYCMGVEGKTRMDAIWQFIETELSHTTHSLLTEIMEEIKERENELTENGRVTALGTPLVYVVSELKYISSLIYEKLK